MPLDLAKLPNLRLEGLQGELSSRSPCVLARSVLRYRLFSLAGLSQAERKAALLAQLAAWQAYPDALYLVDVVADQAQVFAVDRQHLATTLKDAKPQLWPESLLHEPGSDGVRLIESIEGCEGQAWREGVLLASRWWATQPDEAEWQAFARQARVSAVRAPVVQALDWYKPRRQITPAERLGNGSMGSQRLLAVALCLGLTAFAGLIARDAWDAYQRRQGGLAELDQLKQELAPVQAGRDKALALNDRIMALIRQLDVPQPLDVMEHLSQLLPKGSVIRELDLQGRKLRIALELPQDVQRAKVVEALESGGWLVQVSEVKESAARSWVTFEMRLERSQPPRRIAADAGLKRSAIEGTQVPPPGVLPPPPQQQGVRRP